MIRNQSRRPYRIIYHPRRLNKPLRCQGGLHEWRTIIKQGVPYLVCKKCGEGVFKAVKEKTITKKEARDKLFMKARKQRTNREIIEKAWTRLEQARERKRRYGKK